MQQTIEQMQEDFTGLLFTNLVDFDAKWGHRRNVEGYANELESFDVLLGQCMEQMDEDTLLIVTADHGNDPTYSGTDHTRECVPCLMYAKNLKTYKQINDANSFGTIGATILENFGLEKPADLIGQSVLKELN